MKRKLLLGLVTVFFWLSGQAPSVQGVDLAHFRALNIAPFLKAPAVPDLSLLDLEGQEVSFSMFRGKVILLNFWTTW